MPRAGLDRAAVIAAGAALADEVGFAGLTMGRLAERVGVRTPSLYKHVAGQEDLNRGIAALALAEAADAVGTATQGRAGRDALTAAAHAFRDFVLAHPGRYAATIGVEPTGPDDPITVAGLGVLDSFSAVLRSYAVPPAEMDHALRTVRSSLHGFATLQSANGFQWSADVDESLEWLIALLDRGLRSASPQ
ncbi:MULTISPECIES: TetR/AcrR family transcriptional regulator [unclassified Modestobacter]|uniref:TetR/AcrR family transcriptional regulator n=1 Tax=unclassified Modestobacter TaxID=2643866 RepID=UPI0022AB1BE8|nr:MULTISPECIES: TetR/AcrR family transcriptional regulator [unclassified Modestobacter]MCZ2826740.1 WHG domain-containing protein [Modestobacter sp. VKM Ac-2981]MCZ2855120.1 WHG domain-containing protein [Modestobacter sp. VKM Ac-2982]